MAMYFRRKKTMRIGDDAVKVIDYKNLNLLQDYVMESGRMVPSRITGTKARHQRLVSTAIKRARFLALMPYCDMHE